MKFMEIQSGHSELSVISQVSAVEGCPLSGVPLYFHCDKILMDIIDGYMWYNIVYTRLIHLVPSFSVSSRTHGLSSFLSLFSQEDMPNVNQL